MPILVKDYNWQQTPEYITIVVPLKNVHEKDVDILTTKRYIKVNYYPYIFEAFLLHRIDETKSKCFIKDEEIVFELRKVEQKIWDSLETSTSKSEKMELKKKYLAEIQIDTQEANTKKLQMKSELKRVAVREQIEVDTKFRQQIENVKKDETEKALKELQLFQENRAPVIKDRIEQPPKQQKIKEIMPQILPPKNNNRPQSAIPLPRKHQTIDIAFTPRVFPTPSRESRSQEEEEWLTKQAEARRATGFIDEDLRPEERNPQWLKDKGDEFFKAKNYLAAISAYSTGIRISKNLVSLYVNRSAAHYAIGNYYKAIGDCSTGLDLMTPICEANRLLRAKCFARRGAALCKMGIWDKGKGELEAALKLVPNDEMLKQDLKNIECKVEPEAELIYN